MTPDNPSALNAAQKKELLARLLREKIEKSDTIPLTPGQQALWLHQKLAPGSAAYNVCLIARILSDLDERALQSACEKMLQRHPSLRTTYIEEQGKPLQRVLKNATPDFAVHVAPGASEEELLQLARAEADRPFNLQRDAVLRLRVYRGASRTLLLLCIHHIAVDFRSLDLLMREMLQVYEAEAKGLPADLPTLGAKYADYVKSCLEYEKSPAAIEDRAYWESQLSGELPALDLPADHPRPPIQTYHGGMIEFEATPSITRQLRKLAASSNVTLYAALLAAFQVFLHRCTQQERILVGSPMLGRTQPGFENVIGYFINMVALKLDIPENAAFRDLLPAAGRTVIEALAHQNCPLASLLPKLQPVRDPSRSPIFQAALFWDKMRQSSGSSGSISQALKIEIIEMGQRGAPFYLTLVVVEKEEGLSLCFQYNADLFEQAAMGRMAKHFLRLLEHVSEHPEEPVERIPLLDSEERRQLLENWNQTAAPVASHLNVCGLFSGQAAIQQNKIALRCGGESMTYAELDALSNRIAHFLLSRGVQAGDVVAVALERSAIMVAALLGILKSGASYLPLDPNLPDERIAYILEDSEARMLFLQEHNAANLTGIRAEAVPVGDAGFLDEYSAQAPGIEISQARRAYLIYTSGSTGRPKGVEIPHGALINFLLSMRKTPGITEQDHLLAVTPISFDIAALEIFLPLITGASVRIARREESLDAARLAELIRSDGATILQATPATWRMLADSGWRGANTLKALCGGEALPMDLAEEILARAGCLWNLYGPTETTIWSSVCCIQKAMPFIPIGEPIDNTSLHVLDKCLEPAPIGTAGELWIGGMGLAIGYWRRPELTAEKFIPDPFISQPGARLYRTGDLARRHADGSIEFLGRIDHQVKLHGFRIELGEIESVLAQHPLVKAAVVMLREIPGRGKSLVAYLLADEAIPSDEELRRFLKNSLPDYMAPSFFAALKEYPLTPHGKVDRKALPVPEVGNRREGKRLAPPRSSLERHLVEIWEKVLQAHPIGIDDNFFDLGGASLLCLEVCAQAKGLGYPLVPEMMFRHQTVAELADALEAKIAAGGIMDAEPAPTCMASSARALRVATGQGSGTISDKNRIIIESLGVCLPERSAATEEVLAGCAKPIEFPLEKMTGIHSRRLAGDGIYAIDLASGAVEDCLSHSGFSAEEIDLVICCNISRQDRQGHFSFEPSTSLRLKARYGFPNAMIFDINNACAGMFTAILAAEAFLKTGKARAALVASGEYITHLTDTAQREIESFMDQRLACLTLGDAGAAVLLTRAEGDAHGFHALSLYTLGRHASLCIAKASEAPTGGAIMHTDAIRQNAVAIRQAAPYSANVLRESGWEPGSFQRIIMHQTSETALRDAVREINRLYEGQAIPEESIVINLGERGNTATTTHFVALMDGMRNGKIKSGERIVFGVTGSGQTIGSALYALDDLPERMSQPPKKNAPSDADRRLKIIHPAMPVCIETIGLACPAPGEALTALELARQAAEKCFSGSVYEKPQINLLLYSGVFRDEFLCEPSMASMLAGELDMNADVSFASEHKTLAFDALNGAMGFLDSMLLGALSIESGRFRTVMLAAAEIDNNRTAAGWPSRGIEEMACASILHASPDAGGFKAFAFAEFTEYADLLESYSTHDNDRTVLEVHKKPEYEARALELIPEVMGEFLEREGLSLAGIQWVVPPRVSSGFVARLMEKTGIAREKIAASHDRKGDLYTSSLADGLADLLESGMARRGDLCLMVQIAAGIQVGCALYEI